MHVCLIKKLAEMIDGVDLAGRSAGDVFDLPRTEARLLIAEGWAVPEAPIVRRHYVSAGRRASARLVTVAADRPTSRTKGRQAKRILVVEDHDDLRALFRDALAIAGFDVTEAGDGVQALRHIQSHLPDLVVLDLRLPMLSGVDLHQSIRSRKIPIVVVSGSPQDLGDLPVECVLSKPVLPEDLVQTVRRCLAITKAALAPSR